MLAVVKEEPGPGFTFKDIPIPTIGPVEVLVRVRAVGICGSDVPIFNGLREVPYPLIPGHEFSGEIAEVGEGVGHWQPGDRVGVGLVISCGQCWYCRVGRPTLCDRLREIGIHVNGAFAQYVAVPASNLHCLDDQLSFEEGTAIDPLASAYHGVRVANIQDDDVVAIFGPGPIGLYALQVARLQGAAMIVMIGRRDGPLELARNLGADATINSRQEPLRYRLAELTAGRGASVVIEATGNPEVMPEVLATAAKGARVIVLGGFHEQPGPLPIATIMRHELAIFGSLCYTWTEYEHCHALLAGGHVVPIVSRVLPLDHMDQALELIDRGEVIKVVLKP